MASSSTSSIHKSLNFKYDVFLSFRGEDTRTNFVDHLYHALKQQNIETYKDDKNLQKGNKINKELIKAIEESRFHIIVFSKNYASSSWCLDELVKIMECQRTQKEQTVYPIFYHVEPTEVRKQSGEFGKAFAKHKKDEAGEKWRKALEDATSFSGQDLTADKHEAEFIKLIVMEISMKLPSISVDDSLIGMRTRINRVVSSLNTFRDEFCMIGIRGMGGIGKTTLARAVFDQISFQFEGKSFVANVREVSKPDLSGLKKLQQQVLRDVSNDQAITVNNVFDGKNMMKKKMSGRKVLVVLDDVDHLDQLKALAGEPNWFKSGSKIIVTTRDKQVLVAHKVVNSNIHDVNLLTDEEAICLLSRCAFGTESPSPRYEELSRQVVRYAAGLPLTITILGSSLCDANEDVWIDTLKELKEIPLDRTLQRLELSYKGLDTNCQGIFLDVACILKGWEENEAIRVLESRGFHAIRGLHVLEQKSLITISRDGRLGMHDHIQEMGRHIVRRLHPDKPNKHSRLWIDKEIKDILAKDLGTEATTCIMMNLFDINLGIESVMKGLGKMEKLRFLHSHGFDTTSDWKIDEVTQYFPNSLQYLKWNLYPFCSLPKTFQASNLVVLEMFNSQIVQLWKGGERKVLDKLRFLHLNNSRMRILDLGLTPNLEMLELLGCSDLVELHMHVGCPKLKSLKLSFSKLSTLDLRLSPNIETLNLERCKDMVELAMPRECPQLKSLNLNCPKLRSLDLEQTPNHEKLTLAGQDDHLLLHMPVRFPKLKYLKLNDSKLRTVELVSTLEKLSLSNCYDLVELHVPDGCQQLESLHIMGSKLKSLDLGRTPNLKTLSLGLCDDLVQLHILDKSPSLISLYFTLSKLRIFNLCRPLNLEKLDFDGCSNLEELSIPVDCPKLKTLNIKYSKLRILDLRLAPNLETLNLEECCDLVELSMHHDCPNLKALDLGISKLMTLDLRLTPNLEKLKLQGCHNLVELWMHDEWRQLKTLSLGCPQLRRTFDIGLTPNLEALTLDGHDDLVERLISIGCPKLKSLKLINSELTTLKLILNLETLILEDCDLVELHIPNGDVKIESIDIRRCSELKTLDLGRTPNLKSLHLTECSNFVKLHALHPLEV